MVRYQEDLIKNLYHAGELNEKEKNDALDKIHSSLDKLGEFE